MTTTTGSRQPRRFSEGIERVPVAPSVLRVGRFSDGLTPELILTPDVVGSFADGLVSRPDASAELHVGSYGDCDWSRTSRRLVPRIGAAAPAH